MAYSVQKSRPQRLRVFRLFYYSLPVVLTHAISVRSVVMKPTRSGTACGASCPGWNDFAGDLR